MSTHTHIGVYGLITNQDDILLIKKGRGPYKGKYDLPGGKIEFGETQIEALRRELIEETGLTCSKAELFDAASARVIWQNISGEEEIVHHLGFIYKVNFDNTENIKAEADEEDSLGAVWIKLNSIRDIELSPFAHKAVLKYLSE